jgi:hypothetical protein
LKNTNLGAYFFLLKFFKTTLLLTKMMPYF